MARDHLSSEYIRLKELTRRNLAQLVDSEFTLAHTMTDLAETEARLGNAEHARMLLVKVSQAMAVARECLADLDMPEAQKRAILCQLDELEPRMRAVRRQTKRPRE